jgi:hypothetical protein
MNTFNRISKPVSYAVITSILTMSLYLPAANAAMVGTEVVVHAAQAEQERSRISAALNREEVKVKLAALGVDAMQVQARVDALSDEEARTLSQQIDQTPAGGDIIGALVTIFIVLLITDLLGLTSVFSFTHKGAARSL